MGFLWLQVVPSVFIFLLMSRKKKRARFGGSTKTEWKAGKTPVCHIL
jgi:hypothetical protein